MSKYVNSTVFWYKKSASKLRIFFISLFSIFLFFLIFASLFGYQVVSQYSRELPQAKNLVIRTEESSQILDRNKNVLKTLFLSEQRIYDPLTDISKHMQNAVIASEDERFYQHNGFDPKAVIRAIFHNLLSGDFAEGGSTITQQLARNVFLTADKTISRKVKEIILSIRIEQNYKKTEILELYLNQAFFGEGCYGVETASRKYFNKHAKDLTLAEASLLTAVLPAPSVYSIRYSLPIVKEQQKTVLYKMRINGYITEAEEKKALETIVKLSSGNTLPDNQTILADGSDYFVDYVKEEVQKKLSFSELYKGGLKIQTTIDPGIQKIAFSSFTKILDEGQKTGSLPTGRKDSKGTIQPQGAVVVLSPKTGEILAMVGGRNYQNTKFNRSTALRQPGSSFKIFAYTAAIDTGVLSPESILVSEPVNIDGWRPREWTYGYFGAMSVRRAIAISSNIAAVKATMKVGLDKTVEYAKRLGIKSELIAVPSIALGSVEVRPLDMASAYGVLSNRGKYLEPNSILKIEKRNFSEPLFVPKNVAKQVISPQAAYIMTDLLKGPISPDGTASQVGIPDLYMAGKTGTTENFRDGWFVGYTPYFSISVYVGSDSKEVDLSAVQNYGSVFSGKIFKSIMNQIYFGKGNTHIPNTDWERPEGLIQLKICMVTGKIANISCPFHYETHILGSEPGVCEQKHVPKKIVEKDKKTKDPAKKVPDDKKTTTDDKNTAEKPKEPDQPANPPETPSEPNNPTEPPPTAPPNQSFTKPPISDSDTFRVEFSSNKIKKGSPVEINFQINDPTGSSLEIFINGNLVAYLTDYPFRYYYFPEEEGENLFQAVLKNSNGSILGSKIFYFYVFPN